MPNWYVTMAMARESLAIPDLISDPVLSGMISAVSRALDTYCGRWFFSVYQSRHYTAEMPRSINLRADLLSVTALATDGDGDRVYETAWSTTDYDLHPTNAAYDSPPAPYWELRVNPLSSLYLPQWPLAVQIAGWWGYFNSSDPAIATAQTSGGSQAPSVTNLAVSNSAEFQIGHTLFIGTQPEQLFVSGVEDSTHVTVERGVNGSTAATIAQSAPIRIASYPIISEAALSQLGFWMQNRAAPSGVVGIGDQTAIRLPQMNSSVRMMLDQFRRRGMA